jgi:transcriptional regulator with XRE-family HTH domain
MEPGWKQRLKAAMELRGLNPKALARAVGKNERLIYDLLEKTSDPRNATLAAVATALGMTLRELRDGTADGIVRIPISGAVAAGEGWTPIDDGLGELELLLSPGEAIALEVRGDYTVDKPRPAKKKPATWRAFLLSGPCALEPSRVAEPLRSHPTAYRNQRRSRSHLMTWLPQQISGTAS